MNIRRMLATMLILGATSCSSGGTASFGHDDIQPARDLADAYVRALEKCDRAEIRRLVPRENNADSEVEEKIQHYCGREAASVLISVELDMGGTTAHVFIESETQDYPEEKILLVHEEGDWVVALGTAEVLEPTSGTEGADEEKHA